MAEGGLELRPVEASVVLCLAAQAALEALPSMPGTFVGRVATNEWIFVAPPKLEVEILEKVRGHLRSSDADALVLSNTNAWTMWCLAGGRADDAFARLSAVALPSERPGFVQGAIASVGSKVVALPDRICMMVSSNLGHHVRDRVLELCHDLEPELEAPWKFELGEVGA